MPEWYLKVLGRSMLQCVGHLKQRRTLGGEAENDTRQPGATRQLRIQSSTTGRVHPKREFDETWESVDVDAFPVACSARSERRAMGELDVVSKPVGDAAIDLNPGAVTTDVHVDRLITVRQHNGNGSSGRLEAFFMKCVAVITRPKGNGEDSLKSLPFFGGASADLITMASGKRQVGNVALGRKYYSLKVGQS